MAQQTYSFQAEVSQLLHLVTHSLYSNKEIFLRELISNASDACDKLRYEALNHPELWSDDSDLRVRITVDEQEKTIVITDNGIGMNEAEIIENLGTIAKSGTKEFMAKLGLEQKADAKDKGALIGQFGVGFYSGFIVASSITVESRRAGEDAKNGVRWISQGTGEFQIEQVTLESRGTKVILHIQEDSAEFLHSWKIKSIINRYSDHISIPIQMLKQEWKAGEGNDSGEMVTTDEWETVNKATALWARPKSEVSDQEYVDFYKNLSYDQVDPLIWTHNKVEGKTEYTQLLFIPAKAPFDLFQKDKSNGIKLYIKKVFITDDADMLMPNYLRFVRGVLDSADLPLNVSRELLQESRDVKAIRDGNVRRVLTLLEDLSKDEVAVDSQSKYQQFYTEFGTVLKEGMVEDSANRERIAKLLRFFSTHSDSCSVSLETYKSRMKEGQEAIYYLTAESLSVAQHSPQLEIFRRRGIEVLLMTDRVDEWVLSYFTEFAGTPLQSIAKGEIDLGKLETEEEKGKQESNKKDFDLLIAKLKEHLKEKTLDVRLSTRLVVSPACLVVDKQGASLHLSRLLKQAGQSIPASKPILELNPEHTLVKNLNSQQDSVYFHDLADVIYYQALLAEGGVLENASEYLEKVQALLIRQL
ncbi:MAG: molecular chaperone HtpG [Gammaproteobacteria bacterium]|nr:molecular chaperone HtpG [Gammaproteobacteria bacterium]